MSQKWYEIAENKKQKVEHVDIKGQISESVVNDVPDDLVLIHVFAGLTKHFVHHNCYIELVKRQLSHLLATGILLAEKIIKLLLQNYLAEIDK